MQQNHSNDVHLQELFLFESNTQWKILETDQNSTFFYIISWLLYGILYVYGCIVRIREYYTEIHCKSLMYITYGFEIE